MKSLSEEFDLFVSMTYKDHRPLPEVQLKALRMAFYSGCFVTYQHMLKGTVSVPDEEAVKVLQRLLAEIEFNMGTLACVPSHQ